MTRSLSSLLTAVIVVAGAYGCSGAPHDLDLEDLEGGQISGASGTGTSGSGSGQSTGVGVGAGTGQGAGTGSSTGAATGAATGSGTGMGGTGFAAMTAQVFSPRGCLDCHTAATALQLGDGYNLDSLATASVNNRIVPNNENSTLLTKCATGHNGCTGTDYDILYDWIVVDGAPP